jgi:hypothetical protein
MKYEYLTVQLSDPNDAALLARLKEERKRRSEEGWRFRWCDLQDAQAYVVHRREMQEVVA